MLLVPAHPITLVPVMANQPDDLAAPRRLPIQTARLDPIPHMRASAGCLLSGHLTSDLTRKRSKWHRDDPRNRHAAYYLLAFESSAPRWLERTGRRNTGMLECATVSETT